MAATTTLLYVALGLVLGIAVYYMMRYLTGGASLSGGGGATETTYLKTQLPPVPIPAAASARCAYSLWLFLNNLTGGTAGTTVFEISDPAATPAVSIATLRLDSSAALRFVIGAGTTARTYLLKEDFPLQKWTRLDLSFDNGTFDFYLDGKLLRSFQTGAALVTPATAVLQFGAIDAYVNGYSRAAEPMDPAKAQAKYLSGQRALSGSALPKYGVSMQLVKDSVVQTSFSLF